MTTPRETHAHQSTIGARRGGAPWVIPRRVTAVMGVRSAAIAETQLRCTAGPYEVSVHVRDDHRSAEVAVVGMITQSGTDHLPVPDLLVGLVEPGEPAAFVNALTDRFGEFHLNWRREKAIGLQVGYGTDAPCILVWSPTRA